METERTSGTERIRARWSLAPASLFGGWSPQARQRLALGLRWFLLTAALLLVAFAVISLTEHPAPDHLRQLLIAMAMTSGISLLFGELALWLAQLVPFGGVRLKLAIPPLLTALVIALNVVILSRMMFITVADSQLLLGFLLFGVCLALALASAIGSEISHAITRIEHGARRIASGAYSFRLDAETTQTGDEIAQLAAWFNQMAGSVEEAFQERQRAEVERRQVITAVSHDLRTPTASVRAMIEAIDDGVISDPETVHRYQRAIRMEMGRLSQLMDDLFDLSQLEARTLHLRRESVDISDLISDALESCREVTEQAGITVNGVVEGRLRALHADPRQLYRVLNNLIQNAARYTPAGGVILIRARPQPGDGALPAQQLLVQVIDTGSGIAANDLPHVFERSFRGEASRRRDQRGDESVGGGSLSSGAGLGLAIAREIIEMHGGAIWATSPLTSDLAALAASPDAAPAIETPRGTAISFTLPLPA